MKTTYFLSNRKEKKSTQLARQIQMFCIRKGIPLDANILVGISEPKNLETKFNTVNITIS